MVRVNEGTGEEVSSLSFDLFELESDDDLFGDDGDDFLDNFAQIADSNVILDFWPSSGVVGGGLLGELLEGVEVVLNKKKCWLEFKHQR